MWTKREDSILKEEISKSPNNLAEAFRCAARRLKNKSYAACSARWYYVLSKQDKVFSLESDNSSVVNTKNGATKQSKSGIPDKNSSKEELLEYARKHYPVGTRFISLITRVTREINVEPNYTLINKKDIAAKNCEHYPIVFDADLNRWAEIISLPEQPVSTKSTTTETKPKQKGVFLDVNKLESLSITSLRELAVTKLVDVDKKKLIDLIVE